MTPSHVRKHRAFRKSAGASAVFISLLFWGWLWGVWGMLLSIPIIVIVKVVSQHVEQLHALAELLGD
jgi:predicted PurR-regulated permease PerM